MPSHVAVRLAAQLRKAVAVEVVRHRPRLVAAAPTAGQQAIPQLRVLAAARRARAQPRIEAPDAVERRAPEGGAGTRAQTPDGRRPPAMPMEPLRTDLPGAEAPAESTHDIFEDAVRLGVERARQNQTGHRHDVR